ncbi:MAG: peptidylprolyl isomerase [Clostridiales bacterium]|jgi:peptidyl-prolyl cis-trans isomerase B (cyclophilin B)|nr:peptidylprolyl isomerase [Clostridiales bacterium]
MMNEYNVSDAADISAVFHMESGGSVAVRLLQKAAPNTVNSFLYCARQGVYDGHAIERIVPGKYVDLSYRAFSRPEAKYLIPLEYELRPELVPIGIGFGCVCMGGYGALGIAGGEVFFPLSPCPELYGLYPVFGFVTSGHEELRRIASVAVTQVTDIPGVTIYRPVVPEVIRSVTLQTRTADGRPYEYRDPVRIKNPTLPDNWRPD